MTKRRPGPSRRPHKRHRAQVLGTSDICHLCGHPCSTQVDHVIARNAGGPDEVWNYASAHGNDAPCTMCPPERWTSPAGRACNQSRKDKPLTVSYRDRNW